MKKQRLDAFKQRDHIVQYQLDDQITLRLVDGLSNFADARVGGRLRERVVNQFNNLSSLAYRPPRQQKP